MVSLAYSIMFAFVAVVVTTTTEVDSFGVQPVPKNRGLKSSLASVLEQSEPLFEPFEKEEDHLTNQAAAFDGMAFMFSRSDGLPEDTAAVVDHIAVKFLREVVENKRRGAKERGEEEPEKYRLLDIGCGAGVLLRFFFNEANKMGIELEIVGVDVSEQMITFGKGHAINVLEDAGSQHTVEMVCDDFIKYVDGKNEYFDGAIANSCFANFFDLPASVKAMTDCVSQDGIVCVAHPVGTRFVQGLHEMNPLVTPHLMPTESEFVELATINQLKPLEFYEHIEWNDLKLPLYYATAVKEGKS